MDVKESTDRCYLFGIESPWDEKDWTDSDDRIRGGKSKSYLQVRHKHAIFYGHLDFETLGGAGFASQRTTGEDRQWDLSKYDGIELVLKSQSNHSKKYTFILKDQLLPKDPETGREQSTISWEYDFQPTKSSADVSSSKNVTIRIPWKQFTPTYRGKVKKDAKPLKLTDIKRMSIMTRSFFGTQKGDFSLEIISIAAVSDSPEKETSLSRHSSESDLEDMKDIGNNVTLPEDRGFWSWLLGPCTKA